MSRSLLSEETTMIIPRLRRRHLGALAVRVALLLLVAGLSVRATGDGRIIAWFGLLAVAGLPAVLVPAHPVVGPLARLAEVLITALAVVAVIDERANWIGVAAAANAVLPYLPVPVVAATLYRRRKETGWLLGAALVTLALVGHRHVRDPGYLTAIAEWLLISALACGVAIALQESLRARTEQPAQPYAEATRLLTQLRTVARQLPGATLDPGGLAEHLLDELRMVAPATRAAVLSVSGGGRLVVLAQRGAERVDWETALDADSAIADAWASQQPQTAARSQARSAVPPASEAELLRIAQEAITNARKHAGAENLWVTCEVDPPFARVEVSDDGHGIGEQPVDGRYGLAIMAERAERIRGRLEVRPRVPSG